MDRTLKRLFRLYPVARNWAILSNYVTPLHSMQSMLRTCSLTDYRQMTDFTQSLTKSDKSYDTKLPHNVIKVLDIAAQKSMDMSVQEAVNKMSTLFHLFKDTKDCGKDYLWKVTRHIGFISLCDVLNRNVRVMNNNEVIEALKILTYFNFVGDSILIQSLLQMIRVNINEMSLQDIMFTVYLLKKMDSTPLRDALLIALPLVLEINLSTKIQSDDINMLNRLMRFVIDNIKNQEAHNILFKLLLKNKNNMTVKIAWSTFLSLCKTSYLPPIAFDVLNNVQWILITNAKGLGVPKIINILENLEFVVTKNKTHGYKFYNEALVDALVNSALSSDIHYYSGIDLLKMLNNLNYAHIPLLEYLAAKCFEQPDLLKNASYKKLYNFLEGFINADYKPVFWDTIRDAILANEAENNRSTGSSICRFALYLTALDCYSPSLLNKVFSYDVKYNEKGNREFIAKEMLLLYQSIKTLYPMYEGPWPSQETLEYITNLDPVPPAYSLRAALELALGGPFYVHNNLRTKLGHHIDHVVIMRKGGYPIAINKIASDKTNVNYVEDIETPSESQIILIFNLPDTAYAINSQRLKSTWSLRIKSAEALMNCNTVAIHSSSWMKLPEYERVPYLMQAIKLKCEDFSASVN